MEKKMSYRRYVRIYKTVQFINKLKLWNLVKILKYVIIFLIIYYTTQESIFYFRLYDYIGINELYVVFFFNFFYWWTGNLFNKIIILSLINFNLYFFLLYVRHWEFKLQIPMRTYLREVLNNESLIFQAITYLKSMSLEDQIRYYEKIKDELNEYCRERIEEYLRNEKNNQNENKQNENKQNENKQNENKQNENKQNENKQNENKQNENKQNKN